MHGIANMYWMYGNECINTHPTFINLKTGIIYSMMAHYKNLHFKNECIKMQKEYNKPYFDKFEDKIKLRAFL